MSFKSCPNCKTDLWLVHYYSVIVSFAEWRTICSVALAIAAFGSLLEITTPGLAVFAAIAVIPACVRLFRKHACSKCGIEFAVGDEKPQSSPR